MIPGLVLAQTCHAAIDFQHEHPEISKSWKYDSNYIVCLSVPDESSLEKLYQKLLQHTPYITAFREPDLNDELTSISVYGTPEIRKMLRYLPLALKDKSNLKVIPSDTRD